MSDGVNWQALQRRAELSDPAELKSQLDLVAVVEETGIFLERDHRGKWHGLCPFHDDHEPSLDVYVLDDGRQRVGCMACDFGASNDVFDYLQALRGYGFRAAMEEATELLDRCRAGTRSSPEPPQRHEVDIGAFVEDAYARAREGETAAITQLLHDRGINVPVDWLVSEFRVGVTMDAYGVVIPHYDAEGAATAAKTRRAEIDERRPWKPLAVSGSNLGELYGRWRVKGHDRVLLVEGESDVWTMAYLLRDRDWDVLGLPSGAAARPRKEWIQFLSDFEITAMFDADETGRLALQNYQRQLGVIRVAQLDEGMDPTSEDPDRVETTLESAKAVGTAMGAGLVEQPFGGYVRHGDQNARPITDFTLRLQRTIEIEGEKFAFDVALPDGRVVQLLDDDLENDSKLHDWAGRWGYTAVNATKKDARELKRMLLADAPFHPHVRGVQHVGHVDGSFVFPNEVIGAKNYAYIPPEGHPHLEDQIDLDPGRWSPIIPKILAGLNVPEVTTPILGWIAAAPLRGVGPREFPILAVVGVTGSGKSTLLRETLGAFGYRAGTSLTASSKYSVEVFVGSTNAVPIWFDEYRHGAREKTIERLDELILDAWQMSKSHKGGQGDNKMVLHGLPARAPIVLAGEDTFSEGAHLERLVLVKLPLEGKNPDALQALARVDVRGFGRAYLEWLVELIRSGTMTDRPHVTHRPEHGRATVRWGYEELFCRFAKEVCGVELPAFDDTLIRKPHDDLQRRPPLIEAFRACLNKTTPNGPVVWRDNGGELCVSHHLLVQMCHQLKIPLPGSARAVEDEIKQRWDVIEDGNMWGQFLRIRDRVDLGPSGADEAIEQ